MLLQNPIDHQRFSNFGLVGFQDISMACFHPCLDMLPVMSGNLSVNENAINFSTNESLENGGHGL